MFFINVYSTETKNCCVLEWAFNIYGGGRSSSTNQTIVLCLSTAIMGEGDDVLLSAIY